MVMHEGGLHSSAWPSIRSDEGGHPGFVQFCRTAGHMRKWFFTGTKKGRRPRRCPSFSFRRQA
ncbi:hypothetical protein HMPREF3036_00342 [Sutterella sp. KLE1602]|nr:hypothetical protein HMPREF3036_00342 [Sutterella sp. KLE1602]